MNKTGNEPSGENMEKRPGRHCLVLRMLWGGECGSGVGREMELGHMAMNGWVDAVGRADGLGDGIGSIYEW